MRVLWSPLIPLSQPARAHYDGRLVMVLPRMLARGQPSSESSWRGRGIRSLTSANRRVVGPIVLQLAKDPSVSIDRLW